MCGIWVMIKLLEKEMKQKQYYTNFMKLQHRGPDNSSFLELKNAKVGFHRLSIMDTSISSNQPYLFKTKDKTIVFVCNGEIYNYQYLDKKYELNIGQSDCKTIPALYLKYGDTSTFYELFNREVKGEFAFVLLEYNSLQKLQKVIVSRDMIGIRPLYYGKHEDELMFTSEIKGALHCDYSISEYPPGMLSSYTIDTFSPKLFKVQHYNFNWVYNVTPDNQCFKSEHYYLGNLQKAVINSVRRRLNADRPLAFLVSGGVDSSLVAGIAAKLLNDKINTFCCGMQKGTDFVYAKKVADFIGSNHKEVLFTKQEGLNAIKDVVYTTETWDTTTIRASVGQYLVSQHIGNNTNCKVVLVGEGPDEVCSSYLFNYYAKDGKALHDCAIEYVKKIHYFDSRRGDRCISKFGLESRVPLLDPEVIEAYWKIPSDWRHPKCKGIEKWWLRKAFENANVIPKEVLWRKKEAFSDGVSGEDESWYSIIQDMTEKEISDQELKELKAPSKEAAYFKKLFIKYFGENRLDIIPHYWLPKWDKDGNEVTSYMDPSARVLDVYNKKK